MRLADNPNWSASFDIKNAGKIYLREDRLGRLFRVARVVQSPNLFVSFSLTDSWPFTFRNQSSHPIVLMQKNVEREYPCLPGKELKYSWDQPSFSDKRMLMFIAGKESSLDLTEVGKRSTVRVKKDDGTAIEVDLAIKAEGPMVVIQLRDRKTKGAAQKEDGAEKQDYVESFQNVILVRLPYIAISLIGTALEEFLLVYVKDLEVRYAISKEFMSYGITVKWLQIDNQSFDWDHPMLLFPAVISKNAKELEEHPFLSLGIIQSRDTSYGVTYFKYFGLLLQEMSIEVGEELLRRLLDFVNFSILAAQAKTILTERDYSIQHYQVGRDSSEVLFFEFFQMHPIKVNLTFTSTEDTEAARKKEITFNPLMTLLDIFTKTIGNISVPSWCCSDMCCRMRPSNSTPWCWRISSRGRTRCRRRSWSTTSKRVWRRSTRSSDRPTFWAIPSAWSRPSDRASPTSSTSRTKALSATVRRTLALALPAAA